MREFLEVCERAARAGGQILRDMLGRIHAREKSPKDLVTEADVTAQEKIQQILLAAYPDHEFLGEEGPNSGFLASATRKVGATSPAYRWIVDPLDGTMNYVHGLPNFAVSIALQRDSEIILGIVYDPSNDECFSAILGEGAFLNGKRLKTSSCERLDQALIAASFSSNVDRNSSEITRFIEVLLASQSIRRLGSAALNLCYVAGGRLDAYWTTNIKLWDIAAGLLIVREAGGIMTNLANEPLDFVNLQIVASSTPALHQELLKKLVID